MLNKLTIYAKLIIVLSVALLVSIASYWLFSEIDYSKKNINNTKKLLTRNNLLLHKILLSSGQLYENEDKSKKEIADAVFVYDYSVSVIRDGGTAVFDDKEFILPAAEVTIKNEIKEIEKLWYNYKSDVDKLLREQLFIYIKKNEDTIINGKKTEILRTKRVINNKVSFYINNLRNNIEPLSKKNEIFIRQLSDIESGFDNKQKIILLISIVIYMSISVYLLVLFKLSVLNSLNFINDKVKKLLSGKTFKVSKRKETAEFNEVNNNINSISEKFEDISLFLGSLGKDDFGIRLKKYVKSNQVDKGLIALRDKLKDNADKEKQRQEAEELRQWTIEGQAKFNEILRHSSTNVRELSDDVVSNLVLFLNAAQGGLFLLNNKDKSNIFIELLSAFAYDRKKIITKTIALGEGLIGTCALEKNTIWLNNIPADYMEIESGLGEAPPKSLLIVPLKTDNELLGILEIASFYKITKLQVEFVESIAHNIASSLQTTKISERTAELLKESQKKSEELAYQDAEMRNRINELKKAQDEASKRELEFSVLMTAVNNTLVKAEISKRGKILSANILFSNVSDYHKEELHNMSFVDLLAKEDQQKVDSIIKRVLKGETIKQTIKINTKHDKPVWLLSQFTPTMNNEGKITEVLMLANDITKQKEIEDRNKLLLEETIEKAQKLAEKEEVMSNNYENLKKSQDLLLSKEFEEKALIEAINLNLIKAEYDIFGATISANKKFAETFKYSDKELISKNVRDFIPTDYLFEFENMWKGLLAGKNFNGTVKLYDKEKNAIWLIVSFTIVKGKDKKISKILFIANDITQQKLNEEKIKKQTKALEEQEEFMTQNMTEAMDFQETMEKEMAKMKEREAKIKEKFETSADKKYADWLKEL